MSYASAREIDAAGIPVIDIGALRGGDDAAKLEVANALRRAAQSPGFFYISNHGVAEKVVADALSMSRRFFAYSEDEKQAVKVNARHRGFLRVGEAKMYAGARPDLKESFVFGLDLAADHAEFAGTNPLLGVNQWPQFLPQMRSISCRFFDSVSSCAVELMRAFALAMDLNPDTFVRKVSVPTSRGSFIYYPPQAPELGEEQFGVAPHTDYGCLTLLWQDATGGLQVRDANGEWVTAHPIDNTFVVNVGDLLARWSNDRFRSTAHRVINLSGVERYSMALFFDPDADTVIDPRVTLQDGESAHYESTTCAEHILGRYNAAFRYRGKDLPSAPESE